MATLLAPYNTSMQLGSGFNSFTQQLCVDHAVLSDRDANAASSSQAKGPVAQEVTYKLSVIDKVTDITSAMKINPAFDIKYGNLNASGSADIINTSKVKESDFTFMIQVKVVNQVITDHSLVMFNPIDAAKAANFADVYGDCFISGFQEGGEFIAVVSIKASNREKADKLKADGSALIKFTKEQSDLSVKLDGSFDKSADSLMTENETTISVTWTGGGQDLKGSEDDWTFATMKAAALKFPELVAKTPMRTHALLTKYTALRSFFSAIPPSSKAVLPNFEQAGVYTSLLQEAYLDYKTIAKNLQVLAFDVSSGTQKLLEAPVVKAAKAQVAGGSEAENESTAPTAKEASGDGESDSDASAVMVADTSSKTSAPPPLRINKPYPATAAGLESARQAVRMMLNRIVREVDVIAKNPDLATSETRPTPYMSPFLFKDLLPTGEPVLEASRSSETKVADKKSDEAVVDNMTSLADQSGGVLRF